MKKFIILGLVIIFVSLNINFSFSYTAIFVEVDPGLIAKILYEFFISPPDIGTTIFFFFDYIKIFGIYKTYYTNSVKKVKVSRTRKELKFIIKI